jgi:hypothetical protein
MKQVLLIFVWAAVSFGQQNILETEKIEQSPIPIAEPCNDARYKMLLEMPLDSMSERQYSYFLRLDAECRKTLSSKEQENASLLERGHPSNMSRLDVKKLKKDTQEMTTDDCFPWLVGLTLIFWLILIL